MSRGIQNFCAKSQAKLSYTTPFCISATPWPRKKPLYRGTVALSCIVWQTRSGLSAS